MKLPQRQILPRRFAFRHLVLAVVLPGCAVFGATWVLGPQLPSAAQAQTPKQADTKSGSSADAPAAEPSEPAGRMIVDHEVAPTVRTVPLALDWFARHQNKEGSWSLANYTRHGKDKTCKGVAFPESFSAATALGLLPFLAANQTQTTKGPFQKTVTGGIYWLVSHQKANGDLSAGDNVQTYSHGLATVALCEDYALTRDKSVGMAAQMAINFLEAEQDKDTGGWRFDPKDECGTSVFGWQLMALKSAQLAGLSVKPATLDDARKWLKSCGAAGADLGQFSYRPGDAPSPSMSAIGILSNQFLGVAKTDPVIVGGVKYLMANQPDPTKLDRYYWFFAQQAVHNVGDKDWDAWWRQTRKTLIESQVREGCAAGSWNCVENTKHVWGGIDGRITQTSLCCLTLEVYYRYLPLFRVDKPQAEPADAKK